jgi:hypothetical protein
MNRKSYLFLMLALGVMALVPRAALANHPVLVEGEADFDGDGLLGTDEDNDGDRIFGTLTAALAADNGAANQNGKITIVTSGRFPESLLITGANGNVTVEAAPGVEANIDAVLAGADGNVTRQNAPGIVVDTTSNRRVILRHLTIRNWLEGIVVKGQSHVVIEHCSVDQNLNYGIRVSEQATATIHSCSVSGTGFRVGAAGNSPDVNPPSPGDGIHFELLSKGLVAHTLINGNFFGGLVNRASGSNLFIDGVVIFDNVADKIGRLRDLNPSERR